MEGNVCGLVHVMTLAIWFESGRDLWCQFRDIIYSRVEIDVDSIYRYVSFAPRMQISYSLGFSPMNL